jgi:hypothetical protein
VRASEKARASEKSRARKRGQERERDLKRYREEQGIEKKRRNNTFARSIIGLFHTISFTQALI